MDRARQSQNAVVRAAVAALCLTVAAVTLCIAAAAGVTFSAGGGLDGPCASYANPGSGGTELWPPGYRCEMQTPSGVPKVREAHAEWVVPVSIALLGGAAVILAAGAITSRRRIAPA